MKAMLILLLMISAASFAAKTEEKAETIAFSLAVVDGQDGGYCVLKNSDDHVELITEKGALSGKQLKQALRYMSYREQFINSSFVVLMFIPPIGTAVSFIGGSIYPAVVYLNEQESIHAVAGQLVAGGWYGPIMEFLQRRDRLSTITGDGIDFIQKSKWDKWGRAQTEENQKLSKRLKQRLGALIGLSSTQGMGEAKGEKIIERLQIEPEFPGGCDHLSD